MSFKDRKGQCHLKNGKFAPASKCGNKAGWRAARKNAQCRSSKSGRFVKCR